MVRMNITIPDEVAKELRRVKNKSRFIAETLRDKFKAEKRKKMEKILVEGYKQSAKEDQKINKEWEQISLESWE